MQIGIGLSLTGGGRVASVDSDAAAWAAAVTSAGGTYSGGTLAAVSAFAVSAKASGYWTKLNRINLFCGDQLAAALVPLKRGGGSATDTNVNFVGGDYTEATGLTGNGTTKYLDTGLIPSASLTINSTHMALYNRSSTAAAGGSMGANDGTGVLRALIPHTDGIFYSDQYATGTGRVNTAGALATPYGFLVATRTAANLHTLYQNAASVASNATVSGSLPTISMFICANNASGTPNLPSSQPLAGYSIGDGLTGGDVTAYNTHIQAFQLALSRNV